MQGVCRAPLNCGALAVPFQRSFGTERAWRAFAFRPHAPRRVKAAGAIRQPVRAAWVVPLPGGGGSERSPAELTEAAAAGVLRHLPACVLGVAALALLQPEAFSWFHPAYNGQHALMAASLATGTQLPLQGLRRALSSPGSVLDGLALQYAVLPSLAALLVQLLGLPPEYAVGLLLVSCCPGGTASAVTAHLAGGDVPLNIAMTMAGVLGAAVATPLLSSALLGMALPVDSFGMVVAALQVVLLPALAGAALREAFPQAVAALRPLCTLAAASLLALQLGSYVAHTQQFVATAGAAALRTSWPRLLVAVCALHAGGFALGYSLSRSLGLPEAAARSHSIQAGQRNSALAAQLALTHFAAHPLAAVPCALSACVHTALAGVAAWFWQQQQQPGEQQQQQDGDGDGAPLPSLLLATATEARKAVGAATGAARTAALGVQTSAAELLGRLSMLTEQQMQLLRVQAPDLAPAPPEVSGPRQGARPKANPHAMNIVMVGAECAPWSKTGGLGDVMQALPKALAARGHRVMVVAPRYKEYPEAWETGVRISLPMFGGEHEVGFFHLYRDAVDYLFVDHASYHEWAGEIYGGTRQEVLFRCALLTKAALEAPLAVPCGDRPYGESNLLFIANDWHTALLPVYLQAHYRDYGQLLYARSLLVLHNMAHQGRGPMDELGMLEVPDHYAELFRMTDDRQMEHMNVMKAGSIAAHRIVAVSNKYAEECQTPEGGWGLDGVLRAQAWKLRGVVNGIDSAEWDPAVDAFLRGDGYANYTTQTLVTGKACCKVALQRELGLPVDPKAPLLGFIGRLDFQKGVDLIADNYEWLMEQGAQLVLLGSGREDLEAALREMERRCPKQCKAWVGFSVKMAHRITAGCDMLLMPSRFEPCGLNQLYAMAYGTPPVVHAVGGLHDTVQPFNPFEGTGVGWAFYDADPAGFRQALADAMLTWREHPDCFRGIQRRGMGQDLSWDNAAAQYESVLLAAKHQW